MQVFNPSFTTRNANNELVVVIGRQDGHSNPFKGFKVGKGGNIMSWKADELGQTTQPHRSSHDIVSPLVLTDNSTGASVHPVTVFAHDIVVKDMQGRDVTMHFHVQGDDRPWKGRVSGVSSRMVSFKDSDMSTVPTLAQGTEYTVTAEQEVVNVFNNPRLATVRRTGAHVKVYLEVPTASTPFKALKSNGKMTGYTASELVFAA
tara:strand:+ start:121 stop:732 length:612 start_codon:yes stop_codon:yes gene_type:complete